MEQEQVKQQEVEEIKKPDLLDQYIEKHQCIKLEPSTKLKVLEEMMDMAVNFEPKPTEKTVPIPEKKKMGKMKIAYISQHLRVKDPLLVRRNVITYETSKGEEVPAEDLFDSPLKGMDYTDFVKADENETVKLVRDPVFRVRCRFWLQQGYNELKSTFPLGEKLAEYDRTELLNWARAAQLLKDMWLECPYPKATSDAMDCLLKIQDKENGWEELFELFPLLPKIQKYARCNFGSSLWGGNWENIAKDDLTVAELKEWYEKAKPMMAVYRKLSVMFKWKVPGANFSQVLTRARRYTNQYEIRPCKTCNKDRWRGQTIFFKKRETKSNCASSCIYCWGEMIKKRVQEKKDFISQANCFHGDKPWKPVYNCDCGKCLALINTNVWPLIAERSEIPVDELKEHMLNDVKHNVIDWCQQSLKELKKKGTTMEMEEINKYSTELSNVRYISCYGTPIPRAMSDFHNQNVNEFNGIVRGMRARLHLKEVDECVKKAMANRKEKKYDEMFTELDALETAMSNTRTQCSYISASPKRFLQFTNLELVEAILSKAKLTFEICIESAMRCAICMAVHPTTGPNAKEMIFTHEHDFNKGNRRRQHMPCMTCPECFDSYLDHTSSLGKPTLKCPGYRCNAQLKEEYLETVAPKALEHWRLAVFRFEMKKCRNFKFCPNASCGEGFEIKVNCCEADEVSCPKCSESFCPKCNSVAHKGKTCEEVRVERHKETWGEMAEYMAKPTKQCPFCLVWIEKNDGCNHMTCTHCRGEFCWLCFGNWSTHSDCQDADKVVRQTFKELYPFQRFKKPKKKPLTKEERMQRSINYNNFIAGFYTEPEEYEPDETLVEVEAPESIKRRAEAEQDFKNYSEGLMSYQFYQQLQEESVKRQPEFRHHWEVSKRFIRREKFQEHQRYMNFIKGFEMGEECVKTDAVPDQKQGTSPSPDKEVLKTGAAA